MGGGTINAMAFYILAGLAVFSALGILFTKNIVHAVFMLVVVFLGIAGVFLITNAEFVGITQLMIYVGGVLILMMFGIMLTNRIDGQKLVSDHRKLWPILLVGVGLLAVIFKPLVNGFPLHSFENHESKFSVTEQIGINFMTTELVALELTGILLLMALVGAAFLASSDFKKKGGTQA